MASADFSWQALLHASEVHPPHVHETSPVKDILFPPYTRLIYSGHFRIAIGLWNVRTGRTKKSAKPGGIALTQDFI